MILEPRRAHTQRCGAKAWVSRKTESRASLPEDGQEVVRWRKASCMAKTQVRAPPSQVPEARGLRERVGAPYYPLQKGEPGASASGSCHGCTGFSHPLEASVPGAKVNHEQVYTGLALNPGSA